MPRYDHKITNCDKTVKIKNKLVLDLFYELGLQFFLVNSLTMFGAKPVLSLQ